MARDLSPIHPDLRPALKAFPRFNTNRWNIFLGRWILKSLMPPAKIPADVELSLTRIPGRDGGAQIPLRIYKPRLLSPGAPLLLWMHGGGYVGGVAAMDDANLCGYVQALGLVIVSVDYRLAPEHPFPTPLEDCYSALQWTHAHAAELGGDPARLAIGGNSAGGGLAASLAQLARDRAEVPLVFQLLVYPMLDDRTVLKKDVPHEELLIWTPGSNRFGWGSYLGQPGGGEQVPPYAVPARREDLGGLPPAWIGVGDVDLFHEEDQVYAHRLKQAGVPCDLLVVPGAFHGFDTRDFANPLVASFRQAQIDALRQAFSRE